ncbi:hypothetical protein SAMN05444359_1491 [Neolewinella agarilytica]|uniref:Uncharacterized protein n=1 Tax=Neolewinella agarilytica TaxID=478744 RepID=A0A1H9PFK9_9BACT|nr:hypothetical protein SAMN05444359_1491 [Neolewinella agarilytica]
MVVVLLQPLWKQGEYNTIKTVVFGLLLRYKSQAHFLPAHNIQIRRNHEMR